MAIASAEEQKTAVSLTLTVKSAPFMSDPDGAAAYYEALGRAVFLWGRFENGFSYALITISQIPGSTALAPELPVSWKKKAEFWRKAFKSLPQLDKLKPAALAFITDAMSAVSDRNTLFHGHFNGFSNTDPLTASLHSKRHKGTKIEFSTFQVTIDHLKQFAETADRLNTRLLPLSFALMPLQPGWPPRIEQTAT